MLQGKHFPKISFQPLFASWTVRGAACFMFPRGLKMAVPFSFLSSRFIAAPSRLHLCFSFTCCGLCSLSFPFPQFTPHFSAQHQSKCVACMNGTLSPNTSDLNSRAGYLAALTWSTQRILSSLLSLKEGPSSYLHQPSTLEVVITIQNLYY